MGIYLGELALGDECAECEDKQGYGQFSTQARRRIVSSGHLVIVRLSRGENEPAVKQGRTPQTV